MSAARLYAAVACGAAVGSIARYWLSLAMLHAFGPGFLGGTLAANLLGSLIIGFHAGRLEAQGRWDAAPVAREFVMAGFCGGFTTFSVFSLESLLLLTERGAAPALSYVGVSVLLWLAAAGLGLRVGRRTGTTASAEAAKKEAAP